MMRRRRGYYTDYSSRFPPRSVPLEAKGGIKSQSKRGTFGESWWAKRWIEVLESFEIGARLSRGKSYARSGQVLSVHVESGLVKAKVQGSRRAPYNVAIQVEKLSSGDWEKVAKVLSEQAVFTAQLLAGKMPDEIEEAFKAAQMSLFPRIKGDLNTDCSCPDWSNPCKHIAAVYYLLGEEFDRDPFLIFKLRGIERTSLVDLIIAQHGTPGEGKGESLVPFRDEEPPVLPTEPLPADPKTFWGHLPEHGAGFGEVAYPSVNAALPKRLGKFPLWSGEEDFITVMEEIYRKSSLVGMQAFLGELT